MQVRVPRPQFRTIGGPAPIHGNAHQVVKSPECQFFHVHDVRKTGDARWIFKTTNEGEAYGAAEALNHGWSLPEDFATAPVALASS